MIQLYFEVHKLGRDIMLKVTFIDLILFAIPGGLVFILAVHAFSKNCIEIKRYLLSSTLLAIVAYLFRLLPIKQGVDTILNLCLLVVFATIINKIDIISSIKAGVVAMTIGFICEGVNLAIVKYILKKDLNTILNDSLLKDLYMVPSTLIFALIIILDYIRLRKRKELKEA